jgi:FKBP-type peptidyl-prolyl cis-trans isomerase 2
MIKKGDFVELDYTAKVKEGNFVFDTTSAAVAKETDSFNPKFKYQPIIICVGEQQLIKGLDAALVGKSMGKYNVDISAEEGFGKKQAGLLKLIPLKLFTRDKVQPYAGLEVNVDNEMGVIKSVSGGRVIVDFNHPLAGKDLSYEVEVRRIVTDKAEQLNALMDLIRLPHKAIEITGDNAKVTINDQIPQEITTELGKDFARQVGLKEVVFNYEKRAEAKAADHKHEAHDHKHN